MVNSLRYVLKSVLVSLFIVLCSSAFLTAQETKSKFTQRLNWKSDFKAMEYLVEVKNENSDEIIEFKTEENFIEFTMPSGKYSWRVTAYDYLGRKSKITKWKEFEILKAMKPVIKDVEKSVPLKKLDSSTIVEIPLLSESISDAAKVELVDEILDRCISGKIVDGKAVFENVIEGDYKVRITNPGGFSCESQELTVVDNSRIEEEKRLAEQKRLEEEMRLAEQKRLEEEKRLAEQKRLEEEKHLAEQKRLEEEKHLAEQKRLEEEKRRAEEERLAEIRRKKEERRNRPKKDFYVELGAGLLTGITDDPLSKLVEEFKPVVDLKIEYLPKKIGSWKLGGEIESSFEYLLDETNKDYDVYRFVVPVLVNFSIMKEIKPEKMYAGIRAGGGLSFLCNQFEFNSDMRSDSKFLHVGLAGDAQLCARYFINRSFVVELNSSCKYFRISGEDIISVSAGGLLGWRF
ncbi:MAG: hypothetical protein UIT85_01825 [Treponema sp.]|nr:hypothetical protein [Treponema sp.]